jgi:AcrR family transcriptional regulator
VKGQTSSEPEVTDSPSLQQPAARTKGERTREGILRTAAAVASVEGLERLTIGRLARELDMSKSGLYAHFRSKIALQLDTIDAARHMFLVEVVEPAMNRPEGLERLSAFCDGFFSYLEREVFPGGCFFANVQAELNACAGPVRDRVAELGQMWLERLEAQVRAAQELGDLPRGIDPAQLAFELEAIMFIASSTRLLFPTLDILGRARTALRDRLEREVGPSRRSPGSRLRKQ